MNFTFLYFNMHTGDSLVVSPFSKPVIVSSFPGCMTTAANTFLS